MTHKSGKCLALGAALLVALPGASSAFDGDRAGFIFGLGLGLGRATQSIEITDDPDVTLGIDFSKTGLAADLKLGGGASEQLWVYYHARSIIYSYDASDFGAEGSSGADSLTATSYQGISGVGVTYFLAPQAPAFFFSGTLGVGAIAEFAEYSKSTDTGFGFEIGAGYEFAPSFFVEAAYMRAGVDEVEGAEFIVSNTLVTVNWTGY